MRNDPPTRGITTTPHDVPTPREIEQVQDALAEARREIARLKAQATRMVSHEASRRHLLSMTRQSRDELEQLIDHSEAFPAEKALMRQSLHQLWKLIKRAENIGREGA